MLKTGSANISPIILVAGVVGAVVLPVTGVGVGVAQMVRGVANQPEAWVQSTQGKVWDEVRLHAC
jgi:hypothetical protein